MARDKQKNKSVVWLGLGVVIGFVAGLKLWQQHKARQTSPLSDNAVPSWALVTSAESEIGSVYARRLAEKGFNLILVACHPATLDQLAEELAVAHQITVQILQADLNTEDGIEQVESLVVNRDHLAVLVTNAGYCSKNLFTNTDILIQDDLIHRHIIASVRLTRAALPVMMAQKRGAIVNISSLAGVFSPPDGEPYRGPKSYLNAFTEVLHRELVRSGVRVQVLYPGFNRAEFQALSSVSSANLPVGGWLTPERIVERSLKDLANDTVVSVPDWRYRILMWFAPIIPRTRMYAIVRWLTSIRTTTGQFNGFKKKTWTSFQAFIDDIRMTYNNRHHINQLSQVLDRGFIRRLMLVVTQVNGCRYCASFHAKQALLDGMTLEEVNDILDGVVQNLSPAELPALLYAQHWAEEGGKGAPEARSKLVAIYGEEMTAAIEDALQVIKIGNYMGNAWDYMLYSVSGGRWGNATR